MRDRLEQINLHLKSTWGPLLCRPLQEVMVSVTEAIELCSSDSHFQHAVSVLFMRGVRAKDNMQPLDGHIERDVVLGIFQNHIELGTALYIVKAAWAHHAADDECEGDNGDYHEHPYPGGRHLFDKFEDARAFACEIMETVIENCPAQSTNVRVALDMIDGDSQFNLGEWVWDKHNSRKFWCTPERN